jgi:predicted nucleic acid-binding Zn ribbon protein
MGRWEIRRERCRLSALDREPESADPTPIQDVIPGLMKRLGLADLHWLTALRSEWHSLVGGDLARHTRPGRIEGQTLVVFVDSSVWLNEIARYGQSVMLRKVRDRFAGARIGRLRLVLDPDFGFSR